MSPLHAAVVVGAMDAVKALIAKGANLDIQNTAVVRRYILRQLPIKLRWLSCSLSTAPMRRCTTRTETLLLSCFG